MSKDKDTEDFVFHNPDGSIEIGRKPEKAKPEPVKEDLPAVNNASHYS